MTKRILIALNVIAIFTFGAFVLWKKLFSEPTAQPAPAADAAAVAVNDPPPVPDAAPPAATEATISKLEGTVELQLEDGSWQPIAAGDTVPKGAKLRTGEGASVTVKLGANEIALSENNSVVVDLTEVTLAKGSQVDAKVTKSEQDFVVKSEGTEAEAIANDGDFSVVNTGNGVTVATTRGKSRLRAKGKEVEIPKGKQSQVVGDAAPSAPKEIPPELFLKVDQKRRTTRKKQFALRGRGTPGTVITVNGEVVKVGQDGSFEYVASLDEGANRLAVVTKDVLGRSKAETIDVKLDSKAPPIGGTVKWK